MKRCSKPETAINGKCAASGDVAKPWHCPGIVRWLEPAGEGATLVAQNETFRTISELLTVELTN